MQGQKITFYQITSILMKKKKKKSLFKFQKAVRPMMIQYLQHGKDSAVSRQHRDIDINNNHHNQNHVCVYDMTVEKYITIEQNISNLFT